MWGPEKRSLGCELRLEAHDLAEQSHMIASSTAFYGLEWRHHYRNIGKTLAYGAYRKGGGEE